MSPLLKGPPYDHAARTLTVKVLLKGEADLHSVVGMEAAAQEDMRRTHAGAVRRTHAYALLVPCDVPIPGPCSVLVLHLCVDTAEIQSL